MPARTDAPPAAPPAHRPADDKQFLVEVKAANDSFLASVRLQAQSILARRRRRRAEYRRYMRSLWRLCSFLCPSRFCH